MPRARQRRDLGATAAARSPAILRGIEAEREPAFQHRAAHLAGADQHQRAGEVAERLAAYPAAPMVSVVMRSSRRARSASTLRHALGPPSRDRSVAGPRCLGLAGGLEHGGIQRLARALAGPDDELERLVVALAGVERGVEQGLALPARASRRRPARSAWRNITSPSLVHRSKWPTQSCSFIIAISCQHLGAAALRHLQIERAGEMQRLDVVHPGERDMIVGPASGAPRW